MMLPNLLLFLLTLPPLVCSTPEPTLNDDVLGLIVFKAGLDDPQNKLLSWNEDDNDPCNWVGVKCDPTTNRVSELDLSDFSLSGHIGRALLRLQFLKILNLSHNNFTGTINPGLFRLWSLLVVDLSYNRLSGLIQDEFFQQCGSLRNVSFAGNNLTGQIPASLGSCWTLVEVTFSSNRLSGKLPYQLWYLRGLQSLDLSNNMLEGDIPLGIGNLYDLRSVSFRDNALSGQLPWDIASCLVLKLVDFSGNYLSGSLQEWIGKLTNLEGLDLSRNNFSGQVPIALGNLQLLKDLNLSMNQFVGTLADSMTNCINLVSIDVSSNLFTGNIPAWLFKLGLHSVSLSGNRFSGNADDLFLLPALASYQSLQILDLSSNALSGQIPSRMGSFSSLQLLNMSRNYLNGSIQLSIWELKSIHALDLSYNHLTGSLPSEIGGAVSLKELKVEKNFLSGKIPSQIHKCSSLTSLILSENNFTGSIPASIANLTGLQYLDLSLNHLSGSIPKELTNLSHLLSLNVSHNRLQGELPVGGFFNTISPSSVFGNPSLCGSVVNRSCPAVHPKPIVLNPNPSSDSFHSSSLTSSHRRRITLSISSLVAISAAAFILLGVIAVTVLNIHARSSMTRSSALFTLSGEDNSIHSPSSDANYGKLVMFSSDAEFVAGAHSLLSKDCEIGRGGFGVVYHTILKDGRSVAIKKLTLSSLMKSQEDFEREVRKLGEIKHRNIVTLEGYYWTPSLHLLIYEHISSGSLYMHLHDESSKKCLSWRQRFNILFGMAKGLAHLHQKNIIHYNLKSTNILIDSSGEAKVGDFGIAKLLPVLDHCTLSSKVQSALGYMAPEFACRTVKITEKCDVYSFGVLALEVVTARRPVEYMDDDVVILSDMVRGILEDNRVEECVDRRLCGNFLLAEAIPVIKLGLVCASQVPSNRPDMNEVVNMIEMIQCSSESHEELE